MEEGGRGTDLNVLPTETREEAEAMEKEPSVQVLAAGRQQKPPQQPQHIMGVKLPSFLLSLGAWVSKLQQNIP